MAKKKKNERSLRSRILYTLLIALLAIIIYGYGIEEFLADLEDLADEGDTNESGEVIVVEPVDGEWYSVYFTQPINSSNEEDHTGAPIETALINEIDSAQRTIDAALFELNAPDTTAALLRAVERGVTVRIVADDDHNFDDPESTIEELIDAGAQVVSDERSALMHNKFFIVDGQTLWTGSMNITRNGMYNNNNNGLIFRNNEIVGNYQEEFEEMFTDAVFNRRDDTRPVTIRIIDIDGTLIETYFAPEEGDGVVERIVELIDGAEESVRVMAFSFTLEEIGTAMVNKFNEGVTVEGVVEVTGSLRGQLPTLACAGANFRQDGNPNILHHKVFIIDEEIVITGSLNFSKNARDNNNENVLIIHNPDIARAYTAEWQARFDEGRDPKPEDINC